MYRTLSLILVSLALAACTTIQTASRAPSELVNRAVTAAGGAEALGAVKTYRLKGTVRHWEPEQSMQAGGESRLAADSRFDMLVDVGARSARIEWDRDMAYPAPRRYQFTEVVTPSAGYVIGVDSTGRTKQSLESKPAAHAMSGMRLAVSHRELARRSPLLPVDMRAAGDRLSATVPESSGGLYFPALDYRVGDQVLNVMFDGNTGLPVRVRSADYDNIWGDASFDLVLSDWRTMGGIRVATRQRYELDGKIIAEFKIESFEPNVTVAAGSFDAPAGIEAGAGPATGRIPYQWVLRRQHIGTYLDSDGVSFDAAAGGALRLADIAPGVQHVVGGSHNSLVVEMSDHLVVIDAPVTDWQSNWTLAQLKAKYPDKPVKFLVLTHHHMDHAGGIRAYAAAGATIVVGKGNGAHFRKVLARPYARNPDLAERDLTRASVLEVSDRHTLTDGKREVGVYVVENPHADGLMIAHVPDANLRFVTDLWSPGRDAIGRVLTPGQAAVAAFVEKVGISPGRFAGGHGGVADYSGLAAAMSKPAAEKPAAKPAADAK